MCMFCDMEDEFEADAVEAPAKKAVSYFIWQVEGESGIYESDNEALAAAGGRAVRRLEMEPFWIDTHANVPEGMHLVEL